MKETGRLEKLPWAPAPGSDYIMGTGDNYWFRMGPDPADIPGDIGTVDEIHVNIAHKGLASPQIPGVKLVMRVGGVTPESCPDVIFNVDTGFVLEEATLDCWPNANLTEDDLRDTMQIRFEYQADGGGGKPPDDYDPQTG